MTDEERLHMITEQLIIVRDNLFRGMSKSIQKLQARSINEVLGLESFIESPKPIWVGLTDDEGTAIANWQLAGNHPLRAVIQAIETKLKEKNGE